MSDQSTKWDSQWHELLTRCHGESVLARPEFKANLLAKMKEKTAEIRSLRREDAAIRNLLEQSYQQPVRPRREFETRLLVNLKERQRVTSVTRIRTRRRTFLLSGLSSMAAAAVVLAAVWIAAPFGGDADTDAPRGDLRLSVPDAAVSAVSVSSAAISDSFAVVPASYSNYAAADAFGGAPLPASAVALQNIEIDSGSGWIAAAPSKELALRPGDAFRAAGGTGHLEFADGSLVTVSPDTVLQATIQGLTVAEGFMLVAVPEESATRFRLHFPERDIAVEPGTELAVMAAPQDKFAAGGAPAPTVMVVNGEEGRGGLALAKGKNGIGPLFASQVYRMDKYVTPDLPGRALCDAEYDDLNKLFKTETVMTEGLPRALFAGGFGGAGVDADSYSTVMTPAGFTKQGSRWVADSYKNEETIKLRYLSDEYFGFANERRDLARELALGSEVVLDGGDGVFYEIVR